MAKNRKPLIFIDTNKESSCRSFTDRALTIGYDPESADMCELVNNPRSRNLLETELKSMGFEGVRVYFLVVSDKISTQSPTAPSTVPSNDDVPV